MVAYFSFIFKNSFDIPVQISLIVLRSFEQIYFKLINI